MIYSWINYYANEIKCLQSVNPSSLRYLSGSGTGYRSSNLVTEDNIRLLTEALMVRIIKGIVTRNSPTDLTQILNFYITTGEGHSD